MALRPSPRFALPVVRVETEPFQGWGEAPKPWQTARPEPSATAERTSRVSGLVQSSLDGTALGGVLGAGRRWPCVLRHGLLCRWSVSRPRRVLTIRCPRAPASPRSAAGAPAVRLGWHVAWRHCRGAARDRISLPPRPLWRSPARGLPGPVAAGPPADARSEGLPDVVGDGRGRHGEAFADRSCSYDRSVRLAEPSRANARSCRDSLSRNPGQIMGEAESPQRPLARGFSGFPQSRGIQKDAPEERSISAQLLVATRGRPNAYA